MTGHLNNQQIKSIRRLAGRMARKARLIGDNTVVSPFMPTVEPVCRDGNVIGFCLRVPEVPRYLRLTHRAERRWRGVVPEYRARLRKASIASGLKMPVW